MECAIFVGILVGSMASSYIYLFTTSYVMFGTTTLIVLTASLYVMFFVKESIHNGEAERRIGKLVGTSNYLQITRTTNHLRLLGQVRCTFRCVPGRGHIRDIF